MTSHRNKLLTGCLLTGFAVFSCSALAANQSSEATPQPEQQVQPADTATNVEELSPVQAAAKDGDREALKSILQNGSPAEQASAFDALHAIDPDLATDVVITQFRNPESGSRMQALAILDQSGSVDPQTVNTLLRESLRDGNAAVGDYALQALTRRVQSDPSVLQSGDLTGPETQTQLLAKIQLATINQDHSALSELMKSSDPLVQSIASAELTASDTSESEDKDAKDDDTKKDENDNHADAPGDDPQAAGAQDAGAQTPETHAAKTETSQTQGSDTPQ